MILPYHSIRSNRTATRVQSIARGLQAFLRTRLGRLGSGVPPAFALNPNYAFAHDQFALGLAFAVAHRAESIAESRRAAELDPLSAQIWLDAILAPVWERRFQDVKDLAKRGAELAPSFFFPAWTNGWIDIEAGKPRDAIPELVKAKSMK